MSQNAIFVDTLKQIVKRDMPVRVLQTIRQGMIGGGESHLLSLIERLDKKKVESIVLSFTDGPMIDKLHQIGVKTYIIPTKKAFDFSVWKKIKELMYSEKIDIVHAHGTRAASNIFKACSSLDIPMIYTIHGWSFHDLQSPLVKKMRILGERFLTSRATLNISVSTSNQITGKEHFSAFKSTVIYNGIDLEKFNPEKSYENIRNELGIENDSIVIIFLARFEEQKQPLALIRSFSRVSKEFKKLHLLMVGDGSLKENSENLAQSLDLQNRITFMPFRQDVPDLLANADIYVLPSLWEGMPIGLIEAMAMKKIIIATNVDGTKELIIDGENGCLIDKNNLENELVDAIRKMMIENVSRKNLGINARNKVLDIFDSDKMAYEVEKIYYSL